MFATLQMRATETMNNAFNKKSGTVKARVAMANEIAKRCNRFLGPSDSNKFQAWAIEYATNWKAAYQHSQIKIRAAEALFFCLVMLHGSKQL